MRTRFHEDMSMDDIMRRWPMTIRVVLDHGLLCVGCPIASFHSVDDAVREHGIDGERFRADLRAVTDGQETGLSQVRSSLPSASSISR